MSGGGRTVKPTVQEATSDGSLLDGRLSYRQFKDGYRTGIEPVLLAAAVPARPGERVLEAGCGAGAGLMCLCARVGGLSGIGIEADPGTAALARHNWRRNGLDRLELREILVDDVEDDLGQFDHAFANPPWHRGDASASPLGRRDLAKRASSGLLELWIPTLAGRLRPGGSLTLILTAGQFAQAAGLMRGLGGLGGITLLPLWPKEGQPARIVLLQGRRGSAADGVVRPGLVLHQPGGRYTEAVERILRSGAPLALEADARATDL